MAYLRSYDYLIAIQDAYLKQLTADNAAIRTQAENIAQAELTSYLTQKYDTSDEFRDTLVFSNATTYKAKQLVELNYSAYAAATTYTGVGTDYVINAGKAYVLKTSGATGTFDAAKWTLLGNQYDLFYIPTPYDEFDSDADYEAGDIVFWKDKVYKALKASVSLSHDEAIQYSDYNALPSKNVLPDDKTNGAKYWGTGTAYSFTGLLVSAAVADFTAWDNVTTYAASDKVSHSGVIYKSVVNGNLDVTPGTDITKWHPISWTAGDNRSAQLVQKMIYVCIYSLLPRLAHRNRPQAHIDDYHATIEWLRMAAGGEITVDLPKIQPKRGARIRRGGPLPDIQSY